jgi:hypothetical protein
MKKQEMFPSRFLKAADFPRPTDLTIKNVFWEDMKDLNNADVSKPVLYFDGITKGMVLNKSNGDILFDLFGDSDNWVGKKIGLIVIKMQVSGKLVDALRFEAVPATARAATPEQITQSLGDAEVPA